MSSEFTRYPVSSNCDSSSSGLMKVLLPLSDARFVFRDTNVRLKSTQKEAVGSDIASVVVTVDEDYDPMHDLEV